MRSLDSTDEVLDCNSNSCGRIRIVCTSPATGRGCRCVGVRNNLATELRPGDGPDELSREWKHAGYLPTPRCLAPEFHASAGRKRSDHRL